MQQLSIKTAHILLWLKKVNVALWLHHFQNSADHWQYLNELPSFYDNFEEDHMLHSPIKPGLMPHSL